MTQPIHVIYHHYKSATWCSSMTHLLLEDTKDGFALEELWKPYRIVSIGFAWMDLVDFRYEIASFSRSTQMQAR